MVLAGVDFVSCTILVEDHRGWDVRIVTAGEAVLAGQTYRRGLLFLSPKEARTEIETGKAFSLWRGEVIGSLKVVSYREDLGRPAQTPF